MSTNPNDPMTGAREGGAGTPTGPDPNLPPDQQVAQAASAVGTAVAGVAGIAPPDTTSSSSTVAADYWTMPAPGYTAAEWAKMTPEQQKAIYDELLSSLGGTDAAKKVDPTISGGENVYFQIWGVKAPHGYIKDLVNKGGLNVYEIATNELSKVGPQGGILAQKTNYWRDREAGYAATLARLLGRR